MRTDALKESLRVSKLEKMLQKVEKLTQMN